jgi:hypothetical protein
LPWLPARGFTRYSLDRPHMEKVVSEIIFPLLRERPELKEVPHQIEAAIERRRREHDDQQRQRVKLARSQERAATLPADEQVIIAYGEPLWPLPDPESTPPYTYRQLVHAVWYGHYFIDNIAHAQDPNSAAISGRHLTKYIEPIEPGFVAAVRAFFNAYQNDPKGECRLPRIPINFGA